MSKRKPAREDINPVDAVLESFEGLLNDVERQFLMDLTIRMFSSDKQEVIRILRHLRSTLM